MFAFQCSVYIAAILVFFEMSATRRSPCSCRFPIKIVPTYLLAQTRLGCESHAILLLQNATATDWCWAREPASWGKPPAWYWAITSGSGASSSRWWCKPGPAWELRFSASSTRKPSGELLHILWGNTRDTLINTLGAAVRAFRSNRVEKIQLTFVLLLRTCGRAMQI